MTTVRVQTGPSERQRGLGPEGRWTFDRAYEALLVRLAAVVSVWRSARGAFPRMKGQSAPVALAGAFAVTLIADPAWATTVKLEPGSFAVALVGGLRESTNLRDFPDAGSITAGPPLSASDLTTIAWDLSKGSFVFDIQFLPDARSGTARGNVDFSVDRPTLFEIHGWLTAVIGEALSLDVALIDLSPPLGDSVFRNFQQSTATPNESFTVGGTGGDAENILSGSLTGTLLPGTEYTFDVVAEIGRLLPGTSTASGHVQIAFIPEPSVGLLVGLGLAGLAARKKRGSL